MCYTAVIFFFLCEKAHNLSLYCSVREENSVGVTPKNVLVGESHSHAQTVQASDSYEQNIKANNIPKAQGNDGLKSETVSRKAFALQDKVLFIISYQF